MKEPCADEFELIIAEHPGLRPPAGFHETRTRTYYVTVGQRAMLQAVDDLPPEAAATGRTVDMRLRTLADVADELAAVRRPPSAAAEHRHAPS